MTTRLGGKLSKLEREARARGHVAAVPASAPFPVRAARNLLAALATGELAERLGAAHNNLNREQLLRVLLAHDPLSDGRAAGLHDAYNAHLERWAEHLGERVPRRVLLAALATEGLSDWDSNADHWTEPGKGDPTGESFLDVGRRCRLARERCEALRADTTGTLAKARAAEPLAAQRRSESRRHASERGREGLLRSALAWGDRAGDPLEVLEELDAIARVCLTVRAHTTRVQHRKVIGWNPQRLAAGDTLAAALARFDAEPCEVLLDPLEVRAEAVSLGLNLVFRPRAAEPTDEALHFENGRAH